MRRLTILHSAYYQVGKQADVPIRSQKRRTDFPMMNLDMFLKRKLLYQVLPV